MSQPPYPQYPQGPSPYSPPSVPQPHYGYYAPPPQRLNDLTAARRAGMIMFVLGGLLLLMGFCNFVSSALMPMDEFQRQMSKMQADAGQKLPFTVQTFRTLAIVFAGITFLIGLAFIGCGSMVRGGRRSAIIASIVLSSVLLIGIGVFALAAGVSALMMPQYLICACGSFVPGGALVALIIMLVRAIRADTNAKLAWAQQQQQAMMYWQYQQQMMQSGAPPQNTTATQPEQTPPGHSNP